MDIQTFNRQNLDDAFTLFQELSREQGTDKYFTATRETFKAAFLKPQLSALSGLIGYIDDKPVALASYSYDFAIYTVQPMMSFKTFYVRPPHRRHGYAQQILKKVTQEAMLQNCAYIIWDVHKDNKIAQAYYEDLGVTPDNDFLYYAVTPEDMQQKLK